MMFYAVLFLKTLKKNTGLALDPDRDIGDGIGRGRVVTRGPV